MKIYPNADLRTLTQMGSAIFIFIENQFYKWLEQSNPVHEYKEMYFGDEAVCNKRGAIIDAIETAVNEANENGKPVDMKQFDYDAVFAV